MKKKHFEPRFFTGDFNADLKREIAVSTLKFLPFSIDTPASSLSHDFFNTLTLRWQGLPYDLNKLPSSLYVRYNCIYEEKFPVESTIKEEDVCTWLKIVQKSIPH